MSRVGTLFLNLGKWLDGENPGSGPQDGTPSDGLNGDKDKIDVAIGTGHAADGSHKAAVIDATNIKSTAVDGSTLEQDVTTKKLRVKDQGIGTAKLADDSVTKTKLAADTAGPGIVQNTDGSLSPNVDNSTIGVNAGGQIYLKASATPSSFTLVFSFEPGSTVPRYGGIPVNGSVGVAIPKSGKILSVYLTTTGGGVVSATGSQAFAAGAKIGFGVDAGVNAPRVNGVMSFAAYCDDDLAFATVYGEYD